MTLSTSRQNFLASETQAPENIRYGRRGGVFVTSCLCFGFVALAVIAAVIVGVVVYFVTRLKLSQEQLNAREDVDPFDAMIVQEPNLQLSPNIIPSFYRLKLKVDMEKFRFSGNVHITITANRSVNEIILHSKDLMIYSNATLTEQIYEKVESLHLVSKRDIGNNTSDPESSTNIKIDATKESSDNHLEVKSTTEMINETMPDTKKKIMNVRKKINIIKDVNTRIVHSNIRDIKIISMTQDSGDRLIVKLDTYMKPNIDYILELYFDGNISDSLTGFYKSSYIDSNQTTRYLAVSQFEPTSARAAFPCFDEPSFKAKFEISIAHHKRLRAISNTKVALVEDMGEKPDWQWTHFERTLKMSTYIVAYVLTDFDYVDINYLSKDNITKPIRVWAKPDSINRTYYALGITKKLIEYYEHVFGLPYALDKLDMIAIPDFSTGAMENWGLITFRETGLLYNEKEGIPRDKQTIAINVAHELAHQWFGNLVTMKWWTDLWLNEGFATYIEYVGVDHIEPEWNITETFIRDKMNLLRADALKSTSPVSRPVFNSNEIAQKFDEISYSKAADLIRMLKYTIGEKVFFKGLEFYLKQWKYANAEENDLWESMAKALVSEPSQGNLSVTSFMNSWTKQAGYPVVEVNRDYLSGQVILKQRLFTSSKEPIKNMLNQLWQIPISYTKIGSPTSEWSTKPKIWLNEQSFETQINGTEALYVNVDAVGFYRVNYDQKNWHLLRAALKSGLIRSDIARAQLIDDAFNLAKASQLDYSYALDLTTCFINGDDSRLVWELLLNNMYFLSHNLRTTSGYVYFQDYMKILIAEQLKKLNYGLEKPKDDNEVFLLENLIMWDCYMESTRCIEWAQGKFKAWMTQNESYMHNPIPSYLREIVYNTALKHGGRREFEFLWNVFQNSTDPNIKAAVINSLTSTREESLIAMLLEKSITDLPKHYAIAVWGAQPPVGTRMAQNFLINNFDRIHDTFTSIDSFMFPSVLNGAFGSITDLDDLNKLKTFSIDHKEKLKQTSQTVQKLIDIATLRIEWIKKYSTNVNKWFQNFVTGHSKSKKHTTSIKTTNDTSSQIHFETKNKSLTEGKGTDKTARKDEMSMISKNETSTVNTTDRNHISKDDKITTTENIGLPKNETENFAGNGINKNEESLNAPDNSNKSNITNSNVTRTNPSLTVNKHSQELNSTNQDDKKENITE